MYQQLAFGTDGIRGKTNQYPFTPKSLKHLGIAIAKWSLKKYKKNCIHILLGHDTRLSCEMIKQALQTGLCQEHSHLTDGGILPTPAILQIMQHKKNFDFGIVISASHNPYTDNGIKLLDAKTGKLSTEDEIAIIDNFKNISKIEDSSLKTSTMQKKEIYTFWPKASTTYIKSILNKFKSNFLFNKKIVLDCANGATYNVAPKIFKALGAKVIEHAVKPNGTNINHMCGALHPEVIQKIVIENKADIGFAFDGDGDRVVAVSKTGKIKDGDDLLTLLLDHPQLTHEKHVVGTIMTNYGFEQYLQNINKQLIRTKVGDKYIAAKLEKENLLLGGEASGHIIIRNYLISGDGIFVALKVLESIINNNNWNIKTFKKTPQVLINVPIVQKKSLENRPYKDIINKQRDLLHNGRIIIRYSGTENILRIMIEDQKHKSAKLIANTLAHQLQTALNKTS